MTTRSRRSLPAAVDPDDLPRSSPSMEKSRKSRKSVTPTDPIEDSTAISTNFVKNGSDKVMFEDNLSLEACRERLRVLSLRNEELETQYEFLRSDIRFRLESQVESLRTSVGESIDGAFKSIVQQLLVDAAYNKKAARRAPLQRKEFVPQESPLSKMLLYDDENYKTLFNIGVVCLVLWGAAMALEDIDKFGFPNYDLLVWGVISGLEPFFKKWTVLFFASFTIVPLAHCWAESRRPFTGFFLGVLYVALQIWMFTFSAKAVSSKTVALSMPLAMGIMVEQTRLSMKMHSYLREKVLWNKFHFACRPISAARIALLDLSVPDMEYFFSEISKFAFFLFVPTLLFRESYPRTLKIRWIYAIRHLLEGIATVYYSFLIYRSVLPQFHVGVGEPMTWRWFIGATFKCMGPAMATMFLAHYLVLHSIQHVGAELTRFADRGFYQDWWNSRTFSTFYRKWNGVVHDFIHSYLYSDMVELLRFGKLTSLLLSFIISAIVHEYLICVSMGFFLPILGILFTGPGLIFILLTKNKTDRIWNAFMWLMLAMGNGWLLVLYAREYFTRQMVPAGDLEGTWEDFFVPRIYRIQFSSY